MLVSTSNKTREASNAQPTDPQHTINHFNLSLDYKWNHGTHHSPRSIKVFLLFCCCEGMGDTVWWNGISETVWVPITKRPTSLSPSRQITNLLSVEDSLQITAMVGVGCNTQPTQVDRPLLPCVLAHHFLQCRSSIFATARKICVPASKRHHCMCFWDLNWCYLAICNNCSNSPYQWQLFQPSKWSLAAISCRWDRCSTQEGRWHPFRHVHGFNQKQSSLIRRDAAIVANGKATLTQISVCWGQQPSCVVRTRETWIHLPPKRNAIISIHSLDYKWNHCTHRSVRASCAAPQGRKSYMETFDPEAFSDLSLLRPAAFLCYTNR